MSICIKLHSPDASDLAREEVFTVLGDSKSRRENSCLRCFRFGVGSRSALLRTRCFVGSGQRRSARRGQVHDEIIARAAEEGMLLVARQPFSSGLLFQDPAQLGASNSSGDEASIERLRARLLAIRQTGRCR